MEFSTLGSPVLQDHNFRTLKSILHGIKFTCPIKRKAPKYCTFVKIIAPQPAYGTYITPSPATNICIIEIQIPGALLKKKTWAPGKCKFFLWLVLLDCCWTTSRRKCHGLQPLRMTTSVSSACKRKRLLEICCCVVSWQGKSGTESWCAWVGRPFHLVVAALILLRGGCVLVKSYQNLIASASTS